MTEPPVGVDRRRLWAVVDAAFAERRKTIRNALRRLGIDEAEADRALDAAGVDASIRGEALSLEAFAALVEAIPPEALDRPAKTSEAPAS